MVRKESGVFIRTIISNTIFAPICFSIESFKFSVDRSFASDSVLAAHVVVSMRILMFLDGCRLRPINVRIFSVGLLSKLN